MFQNNFKKMEEKRGGARTGAGAPKKEVSEQAQAVMRKALRMIYSTEEDEEAQIEFIKKFIQTPRGMQFIAEHTFGKAPQIIENKGDSLVLPPSIRFVTAKKD